MEQEMNTKLNRDLTNILLHKAAMELRSKGSGGGRVKLDDLRNKIKQINK